VAKKVFVCVFYIEENGLMIELSLTWNLIKKETKMNDHSIECRDLLWKCFCEFLVIWFLLFLNIWMFLFFWIIIKLRLTLSEQKK